MSDLFREDAPASVAPLAERMRPAGFADLLGDAGLFASESPFRIGAESDHLGSVILWGPPGCGKTTVARLLKGLSRRPWRTLSAVESGLPELRKLLAEAEGLRKLGSPAPRLFIDEIHRFNKAQQDGLLPAVESGTVLLVGATTENPSYSLNPALVSRCQVFRLESLSRQNLSSLLERAWSSSEQGLGRRETLEPEALERLLTLSEGDARAALNLLEWCAATLSEGQNLTPERVEACAQRRPPAYDRSGDGRYQAISALHKSVRGSDPQAVVYWLARMLEGGEDPVYVARRLIRMASEDIGLADPQALPLCIAARDACEHLGLPECSLALLEAAVYLALAPKSNSLEVAWDAVRAAVRESGQLPVPEAFLNAVTKFDKKRGVGQGYLYDHDSPNGYSGQNHLPEALRGMVFWSPVERGYERELKKRLDWFESRRDVPPPSEGTSL